MSKTEYVNHHRLKGLDLARYILRKLKDDKRFDINSVSKEFDKDEHFVKSILAFLKEVEWISEDQNGTFSVTLEGQKNCLENLRF